MSASDTDKRIEQMCEFIKQEAIEKATEIKIKTQEEFDIDRQTIAQEGKMKVQEEYAKKEKDLQVQQRIAQSAEIGRQNKRRMVARDDLLNKLYGLAKARLAELSTKDVEKYKEVLKDLIIQGLIKIEEPDIVVRCRKVDMDVVREIIPCARDTFVRMMKEECGEDVEVSVSLNEEESKLPDRRMMLDSLKSQIFPLTAVSSVSITSDQMSLEGTIPNGTLFPQLVRDAEADPNARYVTASLEETVKKDGEERVLASLKQVGVSMAVFFNEPEEGKEE